MTSVTNTSSERGISTEQLDLIKTHIVRGFENVESLLDQVEPIQIEDKPLFLKELEEPSVVWIVEKIDRILQRLAIQVKNIKDLKRIIIYTLNTESLAKSIRTPEYFFIFSHPAVKIALFDPEEYLDIEYAKKIFAPDKWDLSGKTTILSNFEKTSPNMDRWNRQVLGIHEVLSMMSSKGAGNHEITHDTFVGFKNTFKNIPEVLSHPDVRNTKALFKNKPAILIGAGPSINSQLDWIKKNQDRALLVAADTMLMPLTDYGIQPHMIVSIERTPNVASLMDEKREHPNTLLLAAAVLDPNCFARYKGPRSIYFPNNHYNRWLPLERSQLGSGHSCMGLAMAIVSFFECDPILLMGLDLCWSKTGESHMSTVPYLNKDFYKKSESLKRDRAFKTLNSCGEEVETNEYWTMFRYQFDIWSSRLPSKIYNLSPIGLPIKGAKKKSLEEIDGMDLLLKEPEDFFEKLIQILPYERTEFREKGLHELSRRCQQALSLMKRLVQEVKKAPPKVAFERIEKDPLYQLILMPILRTSLIELNSEKEDEAELALNAVRQHLELILSVFSEMKSAVDQFIQKHSREKTKLY